MTARQQAYRKSLIKQIHCTQAHKRMKDDDAWASTLQEWYGVQSSTELSIAELKNLLDVLNGDAKLVVKSTAFRPKAKGDNTSMTALQKNAIESQWQARSREKTPLALAKFMTRGLKREVLFLNALTKTEATKVLTAINRLEA
jgi:hypothetical protein